MPKPKVKDVEDVDAGEQSGDDSEPEYEIDEILKVAKGRLGGGRTSYYVSWKGYGPEDNSWVDANDMGNAQDIIQKYWDKQKKEKKAKGAEARKSLGASTSKKAVDEEDHKSRKSLPASKHTVKSDSPGSPPPAKKRGRPSLPKADSPDAMEVDEEEKPKPAKKVKRSVDEEVDLDSADLGDMAKYDKLPSWERLDVVIDTVEQTPGDTEELTVYLTLTGGERHRVPASKCHKKMPQMLLKFYEKNLKWRVTDVDP